jgi:hypothetical protein
MSTKPDTKKSAVAASIEGTVLTLTFANNEVLCIDSYNLSKQITDAAILHGLKQKLVDAAAIARNPDTGASATIEDKYNAVKEIFDRITSPDGTWNKLRGDGAPRQSGGILLRALMAISGMSFEDAQAELDNCTDDEIKALRAMPKVKAKMEELRPAKKSTVDVEHVASKFGL